MSLDWRRLPSLTSLRAFDATARHRGFAGAARALNVTQAAIAQQVRGLEAELGLSLVVREGRSVGLTDMGRRLARSLAEGFETVARGLADVRDDNAARGLRVTTTPFLSERILMPHLSEFWRAHPGAEISLLPSRETVDIIADRFDLGIRAVLKGSASEWQGTDQILVAASPLIAIAATAVAGSGEVGVQHLPWLWHEGMETKIELMRSCGLDVDDLQRVPIGSANLLLEAVRQGIGVTIFNEKIARAEIRAGGIVEVALPHKPEVSYIAAMPVGPRHPLAEPFIDWVRTLL